MIKELYQEHGKLVTTKFTDGLSREQAVRFERIRHKLNRWQEIQRRIYILVNPECLQNTIRKSLADLKEKLDELMEVFK